jgi:O-antigen ligase
MHILKDYSPKTISLLIIAELLSLCSFLVPSLMPFAFFAITLLALIASIRKLEYGLLLVFTEIVIGSLGYLFWFDFHGFRLSIRIALWAVVMAVWFVRFFIDFLKSPRQVALQPRGTHKNNPLLPYLVVLFASIGWGLVNGFFNNNGLKNIFFDFNGWLYFLLLFPAYAVFKNAANDFKTRFMTILGAACLWLCVKTMILLYIFSHASSGIILEIYRWVRDTRVGEITNIQGGFYRIFFQSHIYVLIAVFVVLGLIAYYQKNQSQNKKIVFLARRSFSVGGLLSCFLSILLSVNILNFSRSNWVGLAFGLMLFSVLSLRFYGWKISFKLWGISAIAAVLGFALIISVVKFPYPKPMGGFDTSSLLSERATELSGEAGLSSRWSLFPKILDKIKESPVLGRGYGAAITYISSDPRVLEKDPSGKFTTFTFEWGWLDIWIKLGLLGVISYIALIIKIFTIGICSQNNLSFSFNFGLISGLIAISIISFFSPYMNHPLGISYLILVIAMLKAENPKTLA